MIAPFVRRLARMLRRSSALAPTGADEQLYRAKITRNAVGACAPGAVTVVRGRSGRLARGGRSPLPGAAYREGVLLHGCARYGLPSGANGARARSGAPGPRIGEDE